MLGDGPNWWEEAACRGVDPAIFFPERGESSAEAKKVCLPCPVSAQCLAYAVENGEKHGVWGGLSERGRRRMRKAKRAVGQCGWCSAPFMPSNNSQAYCTPEHAALAASARKGLGRRAG